MIRRIRKCLAESGRLLRPSARLRRWRCDEGGVAAIEFAAIVPVMLLLFMGMVEMTVRISESRRTVLVANLVGDLVTQSDSGVINQDIMDSYFDAVRYALMPFDASKIRIRVVDFELNGGNPEVKWELGAGSLDDSKCPAPASSDVPGELKSLMESSGNDMVMTRVCRQYDTVVGRIFSTLLDPSPVFVREIFNEPRYVSSMSCSDC